MNKIILAMAFAAFTVPAAARAPAKPAGTPTTDQLIAQLRAKPADDALRLRTIAAALGAHAPISRDAHEAIGAAKLAAKLARSFDEWLTAAGEWAKASNAAPWDAEIYFNEGVAYQQANRGMDAIKAYKWYLAIAPNGPKAKDAGQAIDDIRPNPDAAAFTALWRKIEGRRYIWKFDKATRIEDIIEISKVSMAMGHVINCDRKFQLGSPISPGLVSVYSISYTGMIPQGTLVDGNWRLRGEDILINIDGSIITFTGKAGQGSLANPRIYYWDETVTP